MKELVSASTTLSDRFRRGAQAFLVALGVLYSRKQATAELSISLSTLAALYYARIYRLGVVWQAAALRKPTPQLGVEDVAAAYGEVVAAQAALFMLRPHESLDGYAKLMAATLRDEALRTSFEATGRALQASTKTFTRMAAVADPRGAHARIEGRRTSLYGRLPVDGRLISSFDDLPLASKFGCRHAFVYA